MLVLLLGCADPDQAPAPPTLDEFLHQAWLDYAAVNLDALATGTLAIDPVLGSDEFPLEGTFTDLTSEEAAVVDVEWDADPSDATGFFLVDTLDCSEAELQDALTNPNQPEVFPDNYTAYERTFTSDEEAFFAGDADMLTWDTAYSVSIPLAGEYSTFVHGGVFRLDLGELGAGFATRTWAPNPADAEEPLALRQDYQMEVYFPRDGEMVHVYGMWRQFQLNDETTQDSEILTNLILDGMKGYFSDTSTYCAGLR